ncbi:MAG: hypothetical protein LBD68_11125 [Zoogloeaceae bacterium]|nr:hypothetical protein [Zoogloeaceae bacterium]
MKKSIVEVGENGGLAGGRSECRLIRGSLGEHHVMPPCAASRKSRAQRRERQDHAAHAEFFR